MKETYAFEDGILVIQDPALEINIKTSFSPKKIPNDFSHHPDIVVKKDDKGIVLRAFFEVNGALEGQYLIYYPDGSIETECYYHKDNLHGPSRFYSEDGVTLSETWYFKGKKEGRTIRRYLSGSISVIERHKEGKLHGKQEYYYEDGTLKTVMHYFQGKLNGEVTLFWPSGLKKREVTFQRGFRQGIDRMWSSGGVLVDEGEYAEGDPIGLHRRYFEDGKPLEERNYYTPIEYDHKRWDANGELRIDKRARENEN